MDHVYAPRITRPAALTLPIFIYFAFTYELGAAILIATHTFVAIQSFQPTPPDPLRRSSYPSPFPRSRKQPSANVRSPSTGFFASSSAYNRTCMTLTNQDLLILLSWSFTGVSCIQAVGSTVKSLVHDLHTLGTVYALKRFNMLLFLTLLALGAAYVLYMLSNVAIALLESSNSASRKQSQQHSKNQVVSTRWLLADIASLIAYAGCRYGMSGAVNARLVAAQCMVFAGGSIGLKWAWNVQ